MTVAELLDFQAVLIQSGLLLVALCTLILKK